MLETPSSSDENPALGSSLKQFFLESERLELAFHSLEGQFKSTELMLRDVQAQLYGKVAELDFVSSYLDAILSHISQGILFIDANGIITTYNLTAQDIFGLPAARVLMHSFWDFFPDDLLGFSLKTALQTRTCPKTVFTTLENDKKLEVEIESTFVGTHAHVCAIASQKPAAVAIQGLLVLARNITEFRRLQILANRHDRLKDLGEMAARVAHEIRNPLGGIRGFATLLQQDLKGQPELCQMATQIVEGTDHLAHFVSNILNYVRPLQLHLESVDLVSFMHEMLQLVEADTALNPNMTHRVCSEVECLIVPVDAALLKSAMLNLLVNALQAMPNGGTLSLFLQVDEENAIVKVQDTGEGIAPEHMDKIFSPFFTTKELGNGLGLSEVYKVIQAHNGSIEVQSVLGQGSLFIIKIPLKIS